MTNQKELERLINERIQSGEVELPVFDDIALKIQREVRENKLDGDLICEILKEDLVLVAELLRVANSAFFAGMAPIGSLREAAVRLGVRQIASIVFSVCQKRLYSASSGLFEPRLTSLWRHTNAVSIGSRWVAANAGYRALADDAFVCGLLHDIGKLSLICIIEELIRTEAIELSEEVVDATIVAMHCEHGAQLLEVWNLPDAFKTVVLGQDADDFDSENKVLAIIRLVNNACIAEGIADMKYADTPEVASMAEVQALSLTDGDLHDLSLILQEAAGDGAAQAA